MNDDKKPLDADAMELVRMFGYTVVIDNPDLDTNTPHFHRFSDRAEESVTTVTPLPVVHAAKFAVPCDACYPAAPLVRA